MKEVKKCTRLGKDDSSCHDLQSVVDEDHTTTATTILPNVRDLCGTTMTATLGNIVVDGNIRAEQPLQAQVVQQPGTTTNAITTAALSRSYRCGTTSRKLTVRSGDTHSFGIHDKPYNGDTP
eukprot:Lankesteria_metandrocarpae@DN6619_c0_g1_i1.p1